jgi:hypothetical protein
MILFPNCSLSKLYLTKIRSITKYRYVNYSFKYSFSFPRKVNNETHLEKQVLGQAG